ncbi:unnamed protein product [Caenorhabditis bovis]|uniref:non-specific serine/threonine protein kinase n=1 Tax=Caenorhabditis bovis TaxID=2654633 RepID=A0A8S1F496_9PELO|nr:unnamed protein product [Caenorhabditis bovis]
MALKLKEYFNELTKENIKVAERERITSSITELYKSAHSDIIAGKYKDIYSLQDLSANIFHAAYNEVVRNNEKLCKEKSENSPPTRAYKTKCFELAMEHLKNCRLKKLDNSISWLNFCLAIFETSWVKSTVQYENEMSNCILGCVTCANLVWIEHNLLQNLWEKIWMRISSSNLDPTIFCNYVKISIKILDSVNSRVIDENPWRIVKTVISSLTRAAENGNQRIFWSNSRKYAYALILAKIVKQWGIEARDLFLSTVPQFLRHLTSLINVNPETENKEHLMSLCDDLFELALIKSVGGHILLSPKTRAEMASLANQCVAEALKSANSLYSNRTNFSMPQKYAHYIARWLIARKLLNGKSKRELNNTSMLSRFHQIIYEYNDIFTLKFGESIEPSLQKCNAWSGCLEIFCVALDRMQTDEILNFVSILWAKRKSFAADFLRSKFCQLLSAIIEKRLIFDAKNGISIESLMKYALSLMPNLTSLPNSALLVETILKFHGNSIAPDLVSVIFGTVSRLNSASPPVIRVTSALLAYTEFDENMRFCEISNDENRTWRMRKDIIDWLISNPHPMSHQVLFEICHLHPQSCRLTSSDDYSKILPPKIVIEEIKQYVLNSLLSLIKTDFSLCMFIIFNEFAYRMNISTDLEVKPEVLTEKLNYIDEKSFFELIENVTIWPDCIKIPAGFDSEEILAKFALAQAKNPSFNFESLAIFRDKLIPFLVKLASSDSIAKNILRNSPSFNAYVKKYALKNHSDIYDIAYRFDQIAELLSISELFRLRSFIMKRVEECLNQEQSIEECDADVMSSMTISTCIRNTTPANKCDAYSIDAFEVARNVENAAFDQKSAIRVLRQLRKSPFMANKVVQHVLNEPNLWHIHSCVLNYIVRHRGLIETCLATVPNMAKFLHIYQIEINAKCEIAEYLRFDLKSIDRCKAYIRKPRSEACRISPEDLITLFGCGIRRWARICFRFWKIFEMSPHVLCECLMNFATECIEIGLVVRLAHLLKAIANSEFDFDEIAKFETRVAQQVEIFFTSDGSELDYCHLGYIEFYNQINDNLTADGIQASESRGIFIIDVFVGIWYFLPRMRPHILKIVARFRHTSPQWSRFPQPSHDTIEDVAFAQKVRLFSLLKIMTASEFEKRELECVVALFLSSYECYLNEDEFLKRIQLSHRNSKKLALTAAAEKLKITKDLENLDERFLTLCLNISTIFKDVALFVAPFIYFLLAVSAKPENSLKLFFECARNLNGDDKREVLCFAECFDALGLSTFSILEQFPMVFPIGEMMNVGEMFLKHGLTSHAFAIANLLFDRVTIESRNVMMIQRIQLDEIKEADKLIEFLTKIYVAEGNSVALSSLPPGLQDRPEIRQVMYKHSKEWIRLISNQLSDEKSDVFYRWMSGFRCESPNYLQQYLENTLRTQFTAYPKQIDDYARFVYMVLYHAGRPVVNQKAEIFFEKLLRRILTESSHSTFAIDEIRLIMLAIGNFDPQTIEEHVICAIRHLRNAVRLRTSTTFTTTEIETKSLEIIKVANMLAENRASEAALGLLRSWREECEEWPRSYVDVDLIEIAQHQIICMCGDHRVAEINLRSMYNKIPSMSGNAIVQLTLALSRITCEYRNDLDEGVQLLERGCDQLSNSVSVEMKLELLLNFHSLCIEQLARLEEYRESRSYRMKQEAITALEEQIARLRSSRNRQPGDAGRTIVRLQRESNCAKDDVRKFEDSVANAAFRAVSSALDVLDTIAELEEPSEAESRALLVIFPLIDVIYKYENIPKIVDVVHKHVSNRFVSRLWIKATGHIASKCFNSERTPLEAVLKMMLQLLVIDYPFIVLHTLFMYEYKPNGSEVRNFIERIHEKKTTQYNVKRLREIVIDMRAAHEAYKQFAEVDVKNGNFTKVTENGKSAYMIKNDLKLFKCNLRNLPIPIITQKIGLPRDYSTEGIVTWKKCRETFVIADGLSAPKIWEIQGSNGIWYKIVFKKDDVRQDVLVEQMFDVMNNVLGKPMLRTYNVVPIDTECGLIEFCGGTHSIKELLCGNNRQGGLHAERRPTEMSATTVFLKMKECQEESAEKRRETFIGLCKKYSPVFRHFFYKEFPTVFLWRQKIDAYRESLAAWSIVCYIVGLGDRHASNILFDTSSATFVHIDLGMILEYSKRSLPVPEQVPFRMSRDLLDPILIEGVENGQLAEICTSTMEKLKKNEKVILGVASALLRETMTNFRETESSSGRPSYISEMAIGRLRDKLGGTDDGVSAQPANLQVRRLLREATMTENLSRMFCGWMPFL